MKVGDLVKRDDGDYRRIGIIVRIQCDTPLSQRHPLAVFQNGKKYLLTDLEVINEQETETSSS